jgi:hypothetical protein
MKPFRNRFLEVWLMLSLASGMAHAENTVWSDDFEGNAASRWTNGGVWHIGSPTAGPALNAGFRTHSGTNCASTQNYPLKRDARLVCTNYNGCSSLFIPANTYPRLRFWHWFNFAQALGYVEISTNNGTNWNQISPVYTYAATPSSGGIWSRSSIDLSAYAGQNVQFAFHFTSGGSGNSQGWYVDDVAVVTSAPVFNNPESFEAGPIASDWAVDMGTWAIGRPTAGPKAAHTGTNCAGTVLAGNYPKYADTRLISPPFAVPDSTGQALRFWQWYNFNNALGYVEISTNGNNWIQLSPTYRNGNTGGVWTNISLDLSSYAGQTVQTAFHFTSGSSTAAGWYVDDVSVVAAPVMTPLPTQTIYAGQTLIVTNFATLFPATGTPTFEVVSPTNFPTLDLNPTNGVLTWVTASAQPTGNYTNVVVVTDNNSPPLASTNSFVIVVTNPPPPILTALPTPADSPANGFQFTLNSLSNTTWRIEASSNLTGWLPIFTNTAGTSGTLSFTDLLATNHPLRFYRAVFP